jgi:hypothetical protein
MANLTLRQVKGSPLTIAEMDGNFEYFTGSYTNTGTITAQGFSGSFTGSISGNISGSAISASYAISASHAQIAVTASYISGSVLLITPSGVTITGSLIVSSSNTITNIGALTTGLGCIAGLNTNAMAQGWFTSASANYSHAEGVNYYSWRNRFTH